MTSPSDCQQKKEKLLAIPADHKVKLKESENKDKNQDLA